MTNRTPHASFENKSAGVRWSMDLRYQGASLPNNASRARVEDEHETFDRESVPAACYPPAKDFLVRSQKHPEDLITDASVFHDLRARHRAAYDSGFANVKPVAERRNINPFSLRCWERNEAWQKSSSLAASLSV